MCDQTTQHTWDIFLLLSLHIVSTLNCCVVLPESLPLLVAMLLKAGHCSEYKIHLEAIGGDLDGAFIFI